MNLRELIYAIELKYQPNGIKIHPPASATEIKKIEDKLHFELPSDFKDFYSICNGFDCTKDKFSMMRVETLFLDNEHGEYEHDCMIFAEYQLYSDVWALRKPRTDSYEIFYNDNKIRILTGSLFAFLQRFLAGAVSQPGGLLEWHHEIERK
jgi:hypothetical protein